MRRTKSGHGTEATVGRIGTGPMGAALVAAIAIGSAGCGDTLDARGRVAIDTLASGALHVSNPAVGVWAEGEGWTLDEDLRLGSLEGGRPDAFGRIGFYEVDDEGRIYVFDRDALEVRVFDPDGTHVTSFGREGEGPAEFGNVAGLTFDAEGRLWVIDFGNNRYSLWRRDGTPIRTERRFTSTQAYPWPGTVLDDGRVIEVEFDDSSGSLRRVYTLFDPSGARLATLPTPTFEPPRIVVESGGGQASYRIAFSPNLHIHHTQDGRLWSGISDEYRVVEHDLLTGDTLRIVDRAYTPNPVLAEELDVVLPRYQDLESGRRVDRSAFPAEHPAYFGLFTDDAGYLWVQRARAAKPEQISDEGLPTLPPIYDVFDSEGIYLGAIDAPSPISLPSVTTDFLYGVVRDDLGVNYLVRYRIEGRS